MSNYQDLLNATKPKDSAIIFMNNKMSRDALIKNIDNMAGFLQSIGVKKGDCVGIISPNVPSSIVAFYAVNKLGGVSNIFHPLVPTNDLVKKLQATNTKYVFVYDLFYRKHKKALKKLGVNIIICSAKDYLDSFTRFIFSLYLDVIRGSAKGAYTQKDFRKKYGKTSVTINENTCLLHSSGSEKEKTVVLTNDNFTQLKNKMIGVIGEENLSKERMLVCLPIFHCFGLGVGVHTSLSLGCDIVVMPTFNVKSMARLIKKHKVTVLIVIPSMVRKFVKAGLVKNFASVKHIYCGGDRLQSNLKQQFNDELKKVTDIQVLEGYGLTELSGVCIVNTEKENRHGSIGKPISDVEVVAVDENDNILPANEVGELAIASSTIMKGYFDGSNNLLEYNGKNYFKTGDLVSIDEDGYVFYKDRKKNIIKISGINVFPKDIEELVLQVKGVKQAVCVEHAIDNKPYIYVYVVADKNDETESEIKDIVKQNMLKYCEITKVTFLDKMPLNKNGKIDKKALENKVVF